MSALRDRLLAEAGRAWNAGDPVPAFRLTEAEVNELKRAGEAVYEAGGYRERKYVWKHDFGASQIEVVS